MAQKKCPSCQQWNRTSTEACEYCGALLDHNQEIKRQLKRQGKLPKRIQPSPMFEIKPEYPWWRKLILYIVAPIYWTFFGIISFFIWMVVWASA